MKHLIETSDWSDSEINETLTLATAFKTKDLCHLDLSLSGLSLAMLFFNPSLRTRVSFIQAMNQLQGHAIPLDVGQETWKIETQNGIVMDKDTVEHIQEAIPVLGRYCSYLGVRAFGNTESSSYESTELIQCMVDITKTPLINLESSLAHPCQAFADILTIQELKIPKPKIVLTWTNHPKALPTAVPNSFLLLASRMGWDITIARPDPYQLPLHVMEKAQQYIEQSRGTLCETNNQQEAFQDADIIYAKSWKSQNSSNNHLHQESWMIDTDIMKKTNHGKFMHCLPIRRNVEATDSVLNSSCSKVVDQAENRLHVQKAILCLLAKWNHLKRNLP